MLQFKTRFEEWVAASILDARLLGTIWNFLILLQIITPIKCYAANVCLEFTYDQLKAVYRFIMEQYWKTTLTWNIFN